MNKLIAALITTATLGVAAEAHAQTCACPSNNYLVTANSANGSQSAEVSNTFTGGTALLVNGPASGIGVDVGAGLYAVKATSAGGDGIYGSSGGNGVEGSSTSQSASGIYGHNSANGFGIAGRCTAGTNTCSAVYGQNSDTNANAYAGYFDGNVYITGGITCHNGGTCFLDSKELHELHARVEALESARRPMLSGFSGFGLSFGMLAMAAAIGAPALRRRTSLKTPQR